MGFEPTAKIIEMNRFRWIILLILICLPMPESLTSGSVDAQERRVGARVHPGGTGRYTPGRWGLVGSTLTNENSDQEQEITVVVLPPNGNGVQYARRIAVPPAVSYTTGVPVYVPKSNRGNVDFQYLRFAEGKVDQAVQGQGSEQQFMQSFATAVGENPQARAASLDNDDHPDHLLESLNRFNEVIRYRERGDETFLPLQLELLSNHPELLEPLEHLSISDERLLQRPALMDSLRLWVQRGGRLVVAVNLSGAELWNGLFGSTAPMTFVQEASSHEIHLQINPEYSESRHPMREVKRSYSEPVRYLRTITENIEPIWNIDEWPVVIRLPFGDGEVIGVLIDADGLIEERLDDGKGIPWRLFDAADSRISAIMYKLSEPDLVTPSVVMEQANDEVGYSIPSVRLPLLVALGFPLILIVVGLWFLRRHVSERLIWAAPILALLLAIPPMIAGIRQRTVAPTTVVDFRTIKAIPGQTLLAADGQSILYSPDGSPTAISSTRTTRYTPPVQAGRMEARRQTTTPSGVREWDGISFPAGLTPIEVQSSVAVDRPLSAMLSFDENGLVGRLDSGPFTRPTDLILAGQSPERLSLQLGEDNRLSGGIEDLLSPNSFVSGTLLSSEQNQHEAVYRQLFFDKGRPTAFPAESTVLYWADQNLNPDAIGAGKNPEYHGKALIVQPVQWVPPKANQPITIPSAAIEYKGIPDATGKYSVPFSNQYRDWVSREIATDFLLQFRIPDACLPLQAEEVECSLRIRAPSRRVILSAGNSVAPLTEFETLESPLGVTSFQVPPELIEDGLRSGQFVMKFDVSDLLMKDDGEQDAGGEQDDSWMIEQVRLNIKGRRISEL